MNLDNISVDPVYKNEHMINLLILADFLETEVKDDMFDLSSYRVKDGRSVYAPKSLKKEDCGSIGCAVGWAGHVFGLEDTDFSFLGKSFISFAVNIHGLNSSPITEL